MDLTQVAIGASLLAVSGLAFASPSGLDASVLAAVTGFALLVGSLVVFTTIARDTHP
ncbi:hypothetical protein [Natrarchaeobaculum aegyptiacum]|uniref:hypothetical protein n=1 Tax=Natrarchaeobaculum aegyptiacum TaxID=745377 RepID=UPI00164356A5|nr:hypothetical protein [Natrarchaeobaculum aegyptiacum]